MSDSKKAPELDAHHREAASWFRDPDPSRFSKRDLVWAGKSLVAQLGDLRAKVLGLECQGACWGKGPDLDLRCDVCKLKAEVGL